MTIGSEGHITVLKEMDGLKRKMESQNIRVVNNQFIEGTNMLDMAGIIEHAKELHLPCSGLTWLAEFLRARKYRREDQKRFVYPRERRNPINNNWSYMKNCWDESEWYFVKP